MLKIISEEDLNLNKSSSQLKRNIINVKLIISCSQKLYQLQARAASDCQKDK